MSPSDLDTRAVEAALHELRQIERELTELDLVRRSDALDEAQDAVERLAEIGSSAAILERAAATLGENSGFDRVLISKLDADRVMPRSFWDRAGAPTDLVGNVMAVDFVLRYPLVEAEVARRGGASVIVTAEGPRSPNELRELLGWSSYVLAPLRLRGRTIGLLHAQSHSPDELQREVADIYAEGLAAAFERAVLRETVERHHEELRSAVIGIGEHLDESPPGFGASTSPDGNVGGETIEHEPLTPRESEILQLLGRGQTNGTIATSLLISESTVKFHVKNILLKMGATSRADAVARHLRAGH